jgi:hypothetical protein
MPALRKNASLEAVARAARGNADRLRRRWLSWREATKTRILSSEERHRLDHAWEHYRDVDELAAHLERLAGITREEKTDGPT